MGKNVIVMTIIGLLFLPSLSITPALGLDQIIILNGGTTLYVGGSGPGNYTNIQDAVDNASSGDTIYVYSGIYYERVLVSKSINLIGENKDTTIIDGRNVEQSYVVFIDENPINFTQFSIINSEEKEDNPAAAAIYLRSDGNTVSNCNISNNNRWAIRCCNSENNVIVNNVIVNNSDGIWLYDSSDNIIKNNHMVGNGEGGCDGIWMYNSSDNIISDNTISKNGNGIFSNLISRNNTIINNDISKNWVGIKLRLCSFDNTVISHNVISFSDWAGISLSGFGSINTHINVSSNIICRTSNNYNDDSYGLRLANCEDVVVYNNTIEFNKHGIKLSRSNNNTIIRNEISGNTYFGINLDYHYFHFSWWLKLFGFLVILPSSSKNNKISQNNFMQNKVHAFYCHPINDTYYSNKWNENYWDDWMGLRSELFKSNDKLILGVGMKIKKLIRRSIMIPVISFDEYDPNPQLEPYDL